MLKLIRNSLSFRAGIATAFLAFSVALGAGAVSYQAVGNKLKQILQNEMENRARIIAAHLGNEIRHITDALTESARNTLYANALADSGGRDQYLRPYLDSYLQVGSIPVRMVLHDFRGIPLAENPVKSLTEKNPAKLKEAVDTGRFQFQVDAVAGNVVITLFCPVFYANTGLAEGTLSYQFGIDALCSDVFTLKQKESFRVLFSEAEKGLHYSFLQGDPSPEKSMFYRAEIAVSDIFHGWTVSAEVWKDEKWLNSELNRLARWYVFLGIVGLAIIVPVSLMGARRMLARLSALESVSRKVVDERSLEQKFPQEGGDEIASLGSAFNRMLEELNLAYQELKSDANREMKMQSERFQRVLSASLEGYVRIDMKTKIIEEVNDALCRISGVTCEIWEGQPVPDFFADTIRKAESESEATAWTEEREVEWENGHKTFLLIHCSLDIDEDGERQMVAFLTDISDRKAAEAQMQSVNKRLIRTVSTLEKRDRELTLLNRMNDLLLACRTKKEAFEVVRITAAKLFPGLSGAISVLNAESQNLETLVRWGDKEIIQDIFQLEDCWAMRQGRIYERISAENGIPCTHFTENFPGASLCVPLVVQGKTLGLLWSELSGEDLKESEGMRQLLISLGDAIKLAVSNLELREALHDQAVRDPLTGLYNRRYFSEVIERELARAKRSGLPLSLSVIDLDYFKSVNDVYGHDAGDKVLTELARLLRDETRGADLPFRFGGEEFVLLLPETDGKGAKECLDWLRTCLENKEIRHEGQQLRTITLSAGLACFPLHGQDGEELIRAADSALYRAKEMGRNNVQVAEAVAGNLK